MDEGNENKRFIYDDKSARRYIGYGQLGMALNKIIALRKQVQDPNASDYNVRHWTETINELTSDIKKNIGEYINPGTGQFRGVGSGSVYDKIYETGMDRFGLNNYLRGYDEEELAELLKEFSTIKEKSA